MGAEEEAVDSLEPPSHVIDKDLFIMNSAFSAPSKILKINLL